MLATATSDCPTPDRFDDHHVIAGGLDHQHGLPGRPVHPAERPGGRRRPDEGVRVGGQRPPSGSCRPGCSRPARVDEGSTARDGHPVARPR